MTFLEDVFEELRSTDCQSVRAWENLIDARRAAPWRHKCPRPAKMGIGPIWDGHSAHATEVIEVWCDDVGLGDLFMLAPVIRLAQKRARIRLWAPPRMQWLVDLGFFGEIARPQQGNVPGKIELSAGRHCSVMDLPGVLGINAAVMEEERQAFVFKGGAYRKDISFHGEFLLGSLDCNPNYLDQEKKPGPTDKAPTLAALGDFFCNRGEPMGVDVDAAFRFDVQHAAHVYRGCVTVDTALAHVAGTFGIPTVVMLHSRPNWRWGSWCSSEIRQQSSPVPWYGPHVRAVSWRGSWAETARAAKRELERMTDDVLPTEVPSVVA